MASRFNFRPNETVYCRFTGEAFTVIDCDGCVATLRDRDGNTIASDGHVLSRIVGELTRCAN